MSGASEAESGVASPPLPVCTVQTVQKCIVALSNQTLSLALGTVVSGKN
jgi:hypothetical protein